MGPGHTESYSHAGSYSHAVSYLWPERARDTDTLLGYVKFLRMARSSPCQAGWMRQTELGSGSFSQDARQL